MHRGAADPPRSLDEGDLLSEISGLGCPLLAGRTGAEDDEIEVVRSGHEESTVLCRRAARDSSESIQKKRPVKPTMAPKKTAFVGVSMRIFPWGLMTVWGWRDEVTRGAMKNRNGIRPAAKRG